MDAQASHHEVGSANVFADIGLPDAETHLLKAELVSRIQDSLDQQGLSQTAAAARMGIRQPDLSRILRGRFRGFSVERLLTMLATLGYEVAITLCLAEVSISTGIICPQWIKTA